MSPLQSCPEGIFRFFYIFSTEVSTRFFKKTCLLACSGFGLLPTAEARHPFGRKPSSRVRRSPPRSQLMDGSIRVYGSSRSSGRRVRGAWMRAAPVHPKVSGAVREGLCFPAVSASPCSIARPHRAPREPGTCCPIQLPSSLFLGACAPSPAPSYRTVRGANSSLNLPDRLVPPSKARREYKRNLLLVNP